VSKGNGEKPDPGTDDAGEDVQPDNGGKNKQWDTTGRRSTVSTGPPPQPPHGIMVKGPGREFTWDGRSRYALVLDGDRSISLLLDLKMVVSRNQRGVIIGIHKRPTLATFKTAMQRYIERSDARLLARERERIEVGAP
jgi:hypothetical protein